jgi:hypothetical protein
MFCLLCIILLIVTIMGLVILGVYLRQKSHFTGTPVLAAQTQPIVPDTEEDEPMPKRTCLRDQFLWHRRPFGRGSAYERSLLRDACI